MRIITEKTVRTMAERNPEAASGLRRWFELAEEAEWKHLPDVREAFRHADETRASSGRSVVIFNIAGNKYRLITAIHYNLQRIYVMLLLTHADYDKDRWKDIL